MPGLVHRDDYYETPTEILAKIREIAGRIDIDLCADANNAKALVFIDEERDALRVARDWGFENAVIFCNPPRSKNARFVDLCYDLWEEGNDVFVLMCWNDLGNRYGQRILGNILTRKFDTYNLGKVRFLKDRVPSAHVSRLTYFLCHMRHAQ